MGCLALLRARQEEEQIRKQTRMYDEKKDDLNYRRNARKLSKRQMDAARDLREIESRISHPKLLQFVEKINGEMLSEVFLNQTMDPELIINKFIENKKIEWDNYRTHVSQYEIDKYLPVL